MILLTEHYPPLQIPPKHGLVHPLTRPFNLRNSCILCLVPEHNTQWRDQALPGNHGSITGATSTDHGNRSKSYLFDGTNDFIDLGAAAELDVAFPISIEIGINSSNQAQTYKRIITAPDSFTYDFHLVTRDNKSIEYGYGNNDAAKSKATAFIAVTGAWQHLIFVIEATAANNTYYFNGVEGTTGAGSGISKDGTDVYIGAKQTPSNYFNGYIDEIRIYNRKIMPWEAKALYEQWKV